MSSRPRGTVPPPRPPRINRRFERPGGYRPARPNANPARRVFRRRLARPAFRKRVQGFQHFLSLGITLGLGVILGVALLIFESVYASRVNPNISVDGIPLGGVSLADAPAYLRHKETDRDLQPSVVRVGAESFTITNHQFRARYTLDAAVRQAMHDGHGGDPLGRIWEQIQIMVQGRDYSISGTHDRQAVARYLADLDRKISRSPRGATVGIRQGAVAIVREPLSGQRLDLPAATRLLDHLVSTRSTFTADLPVQTTGSPITHDLAQAAVDQAQALLGQPILFSAGTKIKGFELRPDQLVKLLTFTNRYDERARQWQVAVGIDDHKLRATLAPIAALVEFPPLPAYFKVEQVDGTDYAVPNQGANGVAVDINGTAPLILAAAATHAVTVKVIYPHSTFDVRAARKLQLDTEESVAQLSWAGASNERATNLSNAAKALDNVPARSRPDLLGHRCGRPGDRSQPLCAGAERPLRGRHLGCEWRDRSGSFDAIPGRVQGGAGYPVSDCVPLPEYLERPDWVRRDGGSAQRRAGPADHQQHQAHDADPGGRGEARGPADHLYLQ